MRLEPLGDYVIVTLCTAAARSSGRTGISIQKEGNFTVFGRDLQRRIHAA